MSTPEYVYVASSWRNPVQPAVVEALRAAGIACYDFRNPDEGKGFSWSEVKTPDGPESEVRCEHCGRSIVYQTFAGLGFWEPDYDAGNDPEIWRHRKDGYAGCLSSIRGTFAAPKKGSDWEQIDEYLRMLAHPRSGEGFRADFGAMQRADTFVMVLPCGKSAHLEIGYAIGAGKRTAILLEDPIEPELMYLGVSFLARNMDELLTWMGVEA